MIAAHSSTVNLTGGQEFMIKGLMDPAYAVAKYSRATLPGRPAADINLLATAWLLSDFLKQ